MSLIYVFSEQTFDEALAAYVEEATAAYPDSAALIHIVEDALRDFMQSEYAAKFVAGSSAEEVAGFGQPMPPPTATPGDRPLTHPDVKTVNETSKDKSADSSLSWDDMG